MKIAHLADWHLGRRQFERRTPAGMNQREADVYRALVATVDDLLTVQPDLILVAGDIFDSPRPPNAAVLFLFQQLQRLQAGLPAVQTILIAGNHDSGRTIEAASILPLFRALPRVTVITNKVERVGVVTCVPSGAVKQPFAPVPGEPNILLIHAAVGYGEPVVSGAQMAGWDYVALGDYHTCHQVGPRAWYPGSLEWTSTDPWSEVRQRPEKGYLLTTLEPGTGAEFRPIPTRRYVDLSPVEAAGLGPAAVDALLAQALADVPDDAVVRCVVDNLSREVERALDWKAIRAFKNAAFHLQLDFRRPEHQAVTPEGRAIRRKRLDEIVYEFLGARQLPDDIDRAALQAHGQEYLTVAAEEPPA